MNGFILLMLAPPCAGSIYPVTANPLCLSTVWAVPQAMIIRALPPTRRWPGGE